MATTAGSDIDLTTTRPTQQLDLRGVTCPDTTAETLRVLGQLAVGEVLEVVSDYYPARTTIPYHCAKRGYRYAFVEEAAPSAAPSAAPNGQAATQAVWRLRIERR
jgi:TusA-related sulfurtransferase